MRKIRIFEHISLDGIIEQGQGYAHGDWTAPYRSQAGLEILIEAQGPDFDLLLGRHTYDLWSDYWPKAGDSTMANRLNAATKYIATHRPESLEWGPIGNLGEDAIAGIRDLKSTEGSDLILWGSSTLTSVLLSQGLVDEVILVVYPVLLGQGKRFFLDDINSCKLELTGTKNTGMGVVINSYKYVGSV